MFQDTFCGLTCNTASITSVSRTVSAAAAVIVLKLKIFSLLIRTRTEIKNYFKMKTEFWSDQEVLYNYRADLHGIGNRSIID